MSEAVKITIDDLTAAAAELRRLHALNAELVEALRRCRDMVAHPDNLAFIDAALAKVETGK